jgi:hypothetical protein
MDFVGDLADGPADELVARLRETLALPDDYVESPEGSSAVAAAALVAARRGYNPDNPTVADLLAAHPFDADDSLRSAASAALVRVAADDSELMELWDEAGLRESVETVYRDIRAFL